MTTDPMPPDVPRTRGLTLTLYWSSVITGFLLPWIMQCWVETWHRKQPLAAFFDGLYLRLFGPESGLLWLSLLGAAPFVIYAVFALIHLGTAPRQGKTVTQRRRMALLLTLAAMILVSVWGHYSILTARGSTAGIGFIFLPFYVLIAMPVAYGIGRGMARLAYR
jgi:hypothetical protein